MGILMKLIADKVLSPDEKENSPATIAMGMADASMGAALAAAGAQGLTGGMKEITGSMVSVADSSAQSVPGAPASRGIGGLA